MAYYVQYQQLFSGNWIVVGKGIKTYDEAKKAAKGLKQWIPYQKIRILKPDGTYSRSI